MAIGENIRKLRKAAGLTQKELGTRSGINEAQIRRYELGGENSNPKLETLKKIAFALGVYITDLLGEDANKYLGDIKTDSNPEDYVSPEYPIAFPGLEQKASEIGYKIKYLYNPKSEDYSKVEIETPDGRSAPLSLDELEHLNTETEIYLKFRIEEILSGKLPQRKPTNPDQ